MKKKDNKIFDVIVVGGSVAGLSAAMTLGRSLMNVLVIDNGDPCNKQAPHSHNFITQDGKSPRSITAEAKSQVKKYETVEFMDGLVISGDKQDKFFLITLESGEEFYAKKLLFTTGLKDIMPEIIGFKESWGISILHCPFCHGYEVKDKEIGILGNGTMGFNLAKLIYHWSTNLTVFTNGVSTLSLEEEEKLKKYDITIICKKISHFEHEKGQLKNIVFEDGSSEAMTVIFAKPEFEQKCDLPRIMGCKITDHGFILIDQMQKTTVSGIYAAGDNSYGLRTISVATAAGTKTGAFIVHDLINEIF